MSWLLTFCKLRLCARPAIELRTAPETFSSSTNCSTWCGDKVWQAFGAEGLSLGDNFYACMLTGGMLRVQSDPTAN